MAKYNNQKAKILFLQQMLCETGENHTISMQEILERLQEKDIRAERKSIYDDMEVLRYFGMDIRFRRERPSGYYLAGEMEGKIPVFTIKEPVTGQTESEKSLKAEVQPQKTDFSDWLFEENVGEIRQLKLLCTEAGKAQAEKAFGKKVQFKEKEEGTFIASVEVPENRRLYGWLTAMGEDIRLQKPKKSIQSFRDYLKNLAKEYKAER